MKKHILVVDDEPNLLKINTIRLKAAGYDIHIAKDGEEGLSKAKQLKPDLIMLDVVLPKLDGYKVSQLLKADPNFYDIPIILLSARSGESDIMSGLDAGANIYMTKPFDSTVLLENIRMLIK